MFKRPERFKQDSLILLFGDGERDFFPVGIGTENLFEISNALTQTTGLSLQIAFERDGVLLYHSNVLSFALRVSLSGGENDPERWVNPLSSITNNAICKVTYGEGSLSFYNLAGEVRHQLYIDKDAEVGQVSTATLPPGESAKVDISPNGQAYDFRFEIPRGDTGPQGIQGIKGDAGPQGQPGKDADVSLHNNDPNAHSAQMFLKADKSGLPNRNILINGDFLNPVNQRGATLYSGAVYTVDRWQMPSGCKLEVVDGGILYTCASSSNVFKQYVEHPYIYTGSTLTVSIVATGQNGAFFRTYIRAVTPGGNHNASGPLVTDGVSQASLAVPQGTTIMYLGLLCDRAGGSALIHRIKLEPGNASTILSYPPVDYGTELARCQRYFLQMDDENWIRACRVETNAIIFSVPVPVAMRITPTLRGTPMVYSLTGLAQTGFSFTAMARGNSVVITAMKTAHGLTDASMLLSSLRFDAEI